MHKTEASAKAAAKAAKATMENPKAWKIRVHENLGWHWSLQCWPISVSPIYGEKGYHSFVTTDEDGLGTGEVFFGNTFANTPQGSVNLAYKDVKEFIELCKKSLRAMEKVV